MDKEPIFGLANRHDRGDGGKFMGGELRSPPPVAEDRAYSIGSIPILSFTACRSFCLQPKYRSVVWIDTCPSKNWIWSNSPPD